MPGNQPWSPRELQTLKKNYNKIKIEDLQSKLKRRTIDAIRNKAKDEGLTVPQTVKILEERGRSTPEKAVIWWQ